MLSARVRRIGRFQLRGGANCGTVLRPRRRDGLLGVDGSGILAPVAPSAAVTEAVYALASVAAASGTLILGSWNHNKGGREDQLASRGSDATTSDSSSSSSKTQPLPSPPPSRLLFVSLSIVSFLPYINFAAFACLAAIESFRDRKQEGEGEEEEENKNPFSVLLFSPAALAGFSVFYSLPFVFVALTTTADGGSGSEHSVFAMESLVLGVLHFQAIRLAGERREEDRERRGREASAAAAAAEVANNGEEEEEEASSALFASLAASELERFDARLGLKTAKASRLRELAQATGVLGGRGGGGAAGESGRRRREESDGVASAPVAKNKASLAAALAAAATLERGGEEAEGSRSFDLDFETREWLTSELAKEVEPLVEKKRKKAERRGGTGKGAAAARALLEALEEEEGF